MKITTHESDLQVLPENNKEAKIITDFFHKKGYNVTYKQSDVKGQDWYAKVFIDVFCAAHLKDELIKEVEEKTISQKK